MNLDIKIFLEEAKGGIDLSQGLVLSRYAANVDAGDVVDLP